MSLPAIAPCARCGKVPELYVDGAYSYLSCDDCYDGAPDSSRRSELGAWYTQQRAIEDWNEKMEELAGDLADRSEAAK